MRILFINHTFPGDLGPLLAAFAAQPGHEILFASCRGRRDFSVPGVLLWMRNWKGERALTGIKKINLISAVLVSLSLCGGCTLEKAGNSSQDQTVQEDNKTEQVKAEKAEKEEINEIHLRDKDSLYENDDDTSVVTMYLTVSKGNSSENTYHTWKEINSYSVYDYEDMGVERYQVAGLLQVGDENGPTEGEVG